MLVYSSEPSARLLYVLDFISQEMLFEKAVHTTDPDVFLHYEGVRINYSTTRFDVPCFQITPTQLLFQTGIKQQELKRTEWKQLPAFFPVVGGDISFDLLAAVFYLLSRYEEYLPHTTDQFGRYAATNALAFKEGFLDRPLINEWIELWRDELQERFPTAAFHRPSFRFIPTYDIDMLYSYRGKPWWRNFGGAVRDLLKGQVSAAWYRWRVLCGKERDPYDAYEWLDALHLYCRAKPIYFFLVAQQQLGFDKNLPTSYKPFQELIRYYASVYKIGLHPSWRSSVDAGNGVLKEEKEWLEVVADIDIERSRQHFIKFTLPNGYRRLIELGIRQEYSMGYGTTNGFRASVASSFFWYDLERECSTPLRIYPFCFMDANSFFQQGLTPQQGYTELMKYYAAVKKVKGCFITIWHNSFLGTDPMYKGWKEVYEIFMREDAYWDASG